MPKIDYFSHPCRRTPIWREVRWKISRKKCAPRSSIVPWTWFHCSGAQAVLPCLIGIRPGLIIVHRINASRSDVDMPFHLKPAHVPTNPAPASYAIIAAQNVGGGDLGGWSREFCAQHGPRKRTFPMMPCYRIVGGQWI